MDASDGSAAGGNRRFPGKYIVIGLIVFVVLFLGVSLILSRGLTPAAQRFHNPPPAKHE